MRELRITKPAFVNGSRVVRAHAYSEGGYYRWRIVTDNGAEYVDGGNFLDLESAWEDLQGHVEALEGAL